LKDESQCITIASIEQLHQNATVYHMNRASLESNKVPLPQLRHVAAEEV